MNPPHDPTSGRSRPSRRLPRLIVHYRNYLLDHSGAAFIRAVSGDYELPALCGLAARGTRIVRRAAVLALGMVGDMRANHTLGMALQDRDRGVRLLADRWLRDVWMRDGNPQQQQKLRMAARANENFEFDLVGQITTQLIHENPALAEAYHQRAIACACLGEFDDAVADLHMTLELNPYHFAAAAALAQAMVEIDDQVMALECFQRALRLNPSLDGVRARVQQLQRQLGN